MNGREEGGPPPPAGRREAEGRSRAYALLGSLELSFVLMVLLGVLAAVRALVAQKGVDLSQANALVRWLTEVAPARADALLWPTVATLALFVVNLALSSVEMARKASARRRALTAPRAGEHVAASGVRAGLRGGEGAADVLERSFRRRRWRVERASVGGETRLAATRRGAGHWANLVFHLAFFVIVAGACLSAFTRSVGYVELAPGESFVERRASYLRASPPPLLTAADRNFRLHLDEMDLAFWPEGGVRRRASWIRIDDPSGRQLSRERLEVNTPIGHDGVTIYQGGKEGFIAGVSVVDTAGTRAEGTIHFQFPTSPGEPMRSRAVLPGTRVALELELHTGMLAQVTALQPVSHQGSVSLIKVFQVRGPHEKPLGAVFGGSTLEFQGLTLSFDTLKPFMSFVVVRDEGVPVIFAGLALALLALVAVYFWVPETCWAVVTPREGGGAEVALAGAAERYQSSFAERFRELATELEVELSDRENAP